MMTFFIVLAAAAQAYLLGSVDTGILVSKYLYHDDVPECAEARPHQRPLHL